MSIKSMTAYALATLQEEDLEFTVEIRSYNSRYLDLSLRMPSAYMPLEDRIKQQVQEMVDRGRVEMRVQVREPQGAVSGFEVDEIRARAYQMAIGQLRDAVQFKGHIPLEMILSGGDMIRPVEVERDTEARWPLLKAVVEDALDRLDDMRYREGSALETDFRSRMAELETLLSRIESLSEGLLAVYQKRLADRVAVLVGDTVDVDPARIAQEAAILAEKSDISEELVRARSHVSHFLAVMDAEDAPGRKLNFLLQEFNREFNTMGSKTSRSDVAHSVVEAKSVIEKIREQVQNVA